ncbi:MAG: cysteine desulfurase [Gemmatimonadota bacterium]|nr:cysteine desulfurase [Gemmatimonadota bacterium]
MDPIYLDHAATTPLRPEVRDAMLPFWDECFGNPSSVHRWGRMARAALDTARAQLAEVLGASPGEIVFTRGGTEADNLAVLGRARMAPGAPVVCSAIEHRAVLAAGDAAASEGATLRLLTVNRQGVVELDVLEELLRQNPAVVSVMWVNNEVGTVQPVREIAERCRAAGVTFHTDAVQALGKLAVRVDEVPADLLSISAHKLGGPKGVGALFVRRGTEVAPLLHGGAQERGLRAGTEDVAGAVGLATAAMLAEAERITEMERLRSLRDSLEAGLRERVADMMVNGEGTERSPTILNVSVPGADPEMLLPALDAEGLAVSSGSACSSGAVRASHVLVAMGLPAELAGPSVRFSLGRTTNREHIERALAIFPGVVERLRAFAGA